MSTTRRFRYQRGRRLSRLPRCKWCGDPVKVSDRRPREFCSDRCRQTAHRHEIRDRAKVEGPNTRGEFRDRSKSADPATIDAPIQHLLGRGARWRGGVALDRRTLAKIIRAEIGDQGEAVTSSDGVASVLCRPGRHPLPPSASNPGHATLRETTDGEVAS